MNWRPKNVHSSGSPALRRPSDRGGKSSACSLNHLMVRLGLGDGLGAQDWAWAAVSASNAKCERTLAMSAHWGGPEAGARYVHLLHGDQQAPFHCQLSMIQSDIAGDGY